MKIIAWVGDEPNQKALLNKISKKFQINGVILERRIVKRKITAKLIFEKIIERLFLFQVNDSWKNMHNYYSKKYPDYPKTKSIILENINCDEAYNFTLNERPDLIIVSGTRLINSKMLSLKPKFGILNLHTGLSPYIKGGPNCTNWCIAEQNFHLIGNTIMYIDEGIDSGNIIYSDYTPLTGLESLNEIHLKVMEHAHSIYVETIQKISNGYPGSTPQSEIGEGITYYTKDWTLQSKIKLIVSLKKFKNSFKTNKITLKRKKIKTIRPD